MNSRLTHLLTFGAGFLAGGLTTYYYGRYQCRKMRENKDNTNTEISQQNDKDIDQTYHPKVISKIMQI